MVTQFASRGVPWYRRMFMGFIFGVAALLALAVGTPVGPGISAVAAIGAIIWAIWTRTAFSTLAGFLVGLALVLTVGGLIGAARCAALNSASGSCEGPTVPAVLALGLAPAAIGFLFAALARRSGH